MTQGLNYFFAAIRGWINSFGSNASVGYGYLTDYIITIIVVIVLLSFIKRLV